MSVEAIDFDSGAEAVDAVKPDAIEVENDNAVETESAENADASDADDGNDGNVEKELNTVRKALDKRNRYINNQRQRIRALEAEMQKIKDSFGQNKTSAPEMEKFESVLDYMKADQSYTLEQKLAEQAHNQKLEAMKQQQAMARAEQTRALESQAAELAQSNADFKKVVSENSQVFSAMPEHINEMMTELDDGLAAAYALAKEGRLASIYSMPPHIAAAHLVQAEIRGQQYLQQAAKPKKQTEAPEPMKSIKGTGKSSTKSLDQMSPSELGKWLNS